MRMLSLSCLLSFTFLALPAFAGDDMPSGAERCKEALVYHERGDVANADLGMFLAREIVRESNTTLPKECQVHMRKIQMNGFAYYQKQFDEGWRSDWNSAWSYGKFLEISARDLGIALPQTYYAKRIVVRARNEEIRQWILALCATAVCDTRPTGDTEE